MWAVVTGKSREEKEIPVGDDVRVNTFITHVFVFRPNFVQGTAVNDESSFLTCKLRFATTPAPFAPFCSIHTFSLQLPRGARRR